MEWGVVFEVVNTQNNPQAQAILEAAGASHLPVTITSQGTVQGWNPSALAKLVGVDWHGGPGLSPTELQEVLDSILYHTLHTIKQVPNTLLSISHPLRPRSLGDLTYHIFRLSAAFVDCLQQSQLPEAWFRETAANDVTNADLAAYGEQVRKQLRAFFAQAKPEIYAGEANTYYGLTPVHLLFERTAWHAGQHLRQVVDLLQTHQPEKKYVCPEELFEGLPMPSQLW